jgi:hypothetical protein
MDSNIKMSNFNLIVCSKNDYLSSIRITTCFNGLNPTDIYRIYKIPPNL